MIFISIFTKYEFVIKKKQKKTTTTRNAVRIKLLQCIERLWQQLLFSDKGLISELIGVKWSLSCILRLNCEPFGAISSHWTISLVLQERIYIDLQLR